MNETITKTINWLKCQHSIVLIIVFFILSIGASIIGEGFSFLLNLEDVMWIEPPIDEKSNIILAIIGAIIIGPIFETLIFQTLLYEVAYGRSMFRGRNWLFFILAPIPFGVIHIYSPSYMIHAYIVGMSFIIAYTFTAKINKKNPIVIVTIVHALRNLMALIFTYN